MSKELRQGFLLPPIDFPIPNFPMGISLFPHAVLHISKKIFSMRDDLETTFLLGFFLVILWSDVWTGCVFHHLHLVWIATSGAHYWQLVPQLTSWIFVSSWSRVGTLAVPTSRAVPGQMHILMDVTQMQKINHIILSNGSMCTLSNTGSNAEWGAWK